MLDFSVLLLVLFFAVAFLYAAVGHGGGSGYLALLSISSVAASHLKPVALMLNLLVSGIAFFQFYRRGFFLWRLFLPMALLSIPLSFLGGFTPLQDILYLKSLGVFLLLSVVLLNIFDGGKAVLGDVSLGQDDGDARAHFSWQNYVVAALLGGSIGYVSGLLGIGGGILLSPILLLMGWTQQKQTAALGSGFIFVNSLSGLAGFIHQNSAFGAVDNFNAGAVGDRLAIFWFPILAILAALVLPVLLGGALGSWYGARKFNQRTMKLILSSVLLIAAIKLLL